MNEFVIELNSQAPDRFVYLGILMTKFGRLAVFAQQPEGACHVAVYLMSKEDISNTLKEDIFGTNNDAFYKGWNELDGLTCPKFYLDLHDNAIRNVEGKKIVAAASPWHGVNIAVCEVVGATKDYNHPFSAHDRYSGRCFAFPVNAYYRHGQLRPN